MSQTDTGYRPADKAYFDRRGLRRYAGIASLWAPEEAFALQTKRSAGD